MTNADRIYDRGLQPERTLLAWRRTCLSFAAGSLLAMKFTLETIGVWAIVLGVAGAALAVLAFVAASIGYRRAHTALITRDALSRGGMPMLLGTLAALAVGAACAAFIFLR